MMKCKYCNKDYVRNENRYLELFPESLRKNVEYIPACDCLEKEKEREMEELEWITVNKVDKK